ncbi:MAG: cyclic nucleotide-binding domain-containing protein [Chloroflexota bacterium]
MLSTIEKVILLKDVELFSEMPDELVAQVASLLSEMELAAGQPVFDKGDPGDSLYIIVDGEVRVFDGDQTINYLGESEVFGEMALLDAEPRMASVMATADTLLLRLEQEPFFDLMESRSEVARGVIRVLSARLRRRVEEIAIFHAARAVLPDPNL